jgi:lysophospholipase L1-like esterase
MSVTDRFSNKNTLLWLEGKTIAFIGDSITADLKSNYVTLVANKLTDFINMTNVTIVNSGINSSSIVDALDRLPDLFWESDPEVVILFIGINDSKVFHHIEQPLIRSDVFAESYSALIRRLDAQRVRKKILINLPALMFEEIRQGDFLKDYWYWIPDLYMKYNVVIEDIAQQHNCLVADIYSAFKKSKYQRLFYEDGVHPNIYGHKIISHEVLECLKSLG